MPTQTRAASAASKLDSSASASRDVPAAAAAAVTVSSPSRAPSKRNKKSSSSRKRARSPSPEPSASFPPMMEMPAGIETADEKVPSLEMMPVDTMATDAKVPSLEMMPVDAMATDAKVPSLEMMPVDARATDERVPSLGMIRVETAAEGNPPRRKSRRLAVNEKLSSAVVPSIDDRYSMDDDDQNVDMGDDASSASEDGESFDENDWQFEGLSDLSDDDEIDTLDEDSDQESIIDSDDNVERVLNASETEDASPLLPKVLAFGEGHESGIEDGYEDEELDSVVTDVYRSTVIEVTPDYESNFATLQGSFYAEYMTEAAKIKHDDDWSLQKMGYGFWRRLINFKDGGVFLTAKTVEASKRGFRIAFGSESCSEERLYQMLRLCPRLHKNPKYKGKPVVYINVARGPNGEYAFYPGSTVNPYSRIPSHAWGIRKARSDTDRLHYRVVGRPGWTSDFRVVMEFDPALPRVYWELAETNVIMMIGSMDGVVHERHPESTKSWYDDLRERLCTKFVINSVATNRALPIRQGLRQEPVEKLRCEHCGLTPQSSGLPRKYFGNNYIRHIYDGRHLCERCRLYRYAHGVLPDPEKLASGAQMKIKRQLRKMRKPMYSDDERKCKNSLCRSREVRTNDDFQMIWKIIGTEWVCNACFQWEGIHGHPPTPDIFEKRYLRAADERRCKNSLCQAHEVRTNNGFEQEWYTINYEWVCGPCAQWEKRNNHPPPPHYYETRYNTGERRCKHSLCQEYEVPMNGRYYKHWGKSGDLWVCPPCGAYERHHKKSPPTEYYEKRYPEERRCKNSLCGEYEVPINGKFTKKWLKSGNLWVCKACHSWEQLNKKSPPPSYFEKRRANAAKKAKQAERTGS